MGENIFVREYTLLEQLHIFGGFLDTCSALYPRIQDVDLRTQATRLEVPVYLAQGAHEAPDEGPRRDRGHREVGAARPGGLIRHGDGNCAGPARP